MVQSIRFLRSSSCGLFEQNLSQDQFIMAYGGLRGAVCYGLVMSLPDEMKIKKMLVTTTIFVVAFTTVIQVCEYPNKLNKSRKCAYCIRWFQSIAFSQVLMSAIIEGSTIRACVMRLQVRLSKKCDKEAAHDNPYKVFGLVNKEVRS